MRIERIKSNLNSTTHQQKDDRCELCEGKDFVWDYSKGDIICTSCGAVMSSGIVQNDTAYDYNVDTCHNDFHAYQDNARQSVFDPIYVRYFHFNEVLATLTLEGPWINTADYREIKRMLKDRNIQRPTRGDIQGVCQSLNKKYNVQRFTKKYCEKWIQIVYRYCGERPPLMTHELINNLRRDFRIMVNRWNDVEALLNGSKKTDKRVQWPNYLETIYRLLKRRYPLALPSLKPWITRLSQKKRRELKLFFEKVFILVGF